MSGKRSCKDLEVKLNHINARIAIKGFKYTYNYYSSHYNIYVKDVRDSRGVGFQAYDGIMNIMNRI